MLEPELRSDAYWRSAAHMVTEESAGFVVAPTTRSEWVYFARAGRYLKIGWSINPHARVWQLRYPYGRRVPKSPPAAVCRQAELFRVARGSADAEAAFHWLARNYRAVGEWYWALPPLVNAIEALTEPAPPPSPDDHVARSSRSERAVDRDAWAAWAANAEARMRQRRV